MPGLKLEPGHASYARSLIALFLIGVSTLGLMYTVQPLMVPIGAEFNRGATETSLLISATTAGIAVAVIPFGRLSSRLGRARSMQVGLALAGSAGVASALASSWELLIAARGLVGVGLAFVMVSAMAWVVDEATPWAVARMGGLYISGTTLGGVLGRLSAGLFTELADWRLGVMATTAIAVAGGIVAHLLLPRSSTPTRAPRARSSTGADPHRGFRVRMYLVGALGMATFVGIFNVTTYRVAGEPFRLGVGLTSLIFITYLAGTFTSAVAGRWVGRYSLRLVMTVLGVASLTGVLVTLIDALWAIVLGLLLLAAGFLGMHAVANAGAAKYSPAPSESSAYYSLSYYAGSSIGGILLGYAWDAGGWPLVVTVALALLVAVGTAGGTAPTPHAT